MNNWRPSASIAILKQRAKLLADIRRYFAEHNVLEVETPILANHSVTDPHLDPFSSRFEHHSSGVSKSLYLQTSPEYAMKRLLAAGSGPIFQMFKAFRNEAAGRHHNPEFTMLEWYRPGFNDHDLMNEMEDMLAPLLKVDRFIKLSYQQAFLQFLQIDPLVISEPQLLDYLQQIDADDWLFEQPKQTQLQWLFSMKVEPQLGIKDQATPLPCFVYDFPSEQAALAKVNPKDPRVAHRFELYFKGIELANGFYELDDHIEQQSRFEKDNEYRQQLGKTQQLADVYLLAALEHGLPDCAGVALGIDRLLMLITGVNSISEVVSFTVDNA